MNKIILVIIAIIVVGVVGCLAYWPINKTETPKEIEKAVLEPKNGTYVVEGKSVILKNGYSEEEIAPGSASKLITQYFGNEVKADFNGDGVQDVAFLLTQDGGGSGTFYYVAALLSNKERFIGTNAILLGDRIAPQTTEFSNGMIVVNYADRKPGEPFTTQPSVGVSKYFKIIDGKVVEIKL